MRFETGVPIGSGGTGEVFRAWDQDLERHVALKILRMDSPEGVERLLREARLQSRIDHPNICKVYDTGRYRGRPFIAMQLIDGEPLDEALAGCGPREAARLVATVARAVEVAHREGLVHRDLKPSNILVETADDGALVPYVVDFGIAREQEAPGPTMTGQVVGTPGYMAPEQAAGAVSQLDHRADVFSLGVILFQLLTDRLPYEGNSSAEVLVGLLQHEAPPLRSIARGVHPDLGAIVDSCLERDPDRRYPSAGALADDLERFFDGDPVSVRPLSTTRRLARRARRHPWISGFAIASVLAAITLVAMMIWVRIETRREIARVQQFNQELEADRSQLRHHAMAPIHDASVFRTSLRQRVHELASEVRQLGRAARGPGSLAVGRNLLALDDPEGARRFIEAAWDLGYRNPETRLALGRVHGELFQRRLEDAARIEDPELRRAAVAQAEQDHLGKAVEHLEAARKEADGSTLRYLEALLALYRGRYAEARELASLVLAESPWLFEAELVTARAHQAEALAAVRDGELQTADDHFAAAFEAWRRVREIAPSDLAAYLGEADARAQRAEVVSSRGREGWADEIDTGLAILDIASRVDPQSARLAALRSRLLRLAAWNEAQRGGDPRSGLEEAVAAAERAIELDPDEPQGHRALGLAHTRLGAWFELRGEPALVVYEEAEKALLAALELRPGSYESLVALGEMRLLLARYVRRYREDDPEPALERALEAFERAQRLGLGTAGEVGAGLVYSQWAELFDPGTADERRLQAAGLKACRRAVEIDPENARAWLCLGRLHRRELEATHRRREDTEPVLARVTNTLGRALELRPDLAEAHYELGRALLEQAEYQTRLGQDGGPLVERATAAFERAAIANPEHPWALGRIGRAVELAALLKRLRGEDPIPEYRRQIVLQQRALEVNPRNRDALMGLGEAHFQIALQIARRFGRLASSELDKAEAAFQRMVEVDPGVGWMKLGWVELARAGGKFAQDESDPWPHVERAREHQERSAAAGGGRYAWLLRGPIELQAARQRIRQGESPAAELATAERAIARAREIGLAGHQVEAMRIEGLVHYLRAEGGVGDRIAELATAESIFRQALAIDEGSLVLREDLARCLLAQALDADDSDPAEAARLRNAARELLRSLLELDPTSRGGRELLAELAGPRGVEATR